MGSINSFGQAVPGILINNYLKSNCEYSEISGFFPHFLEVHMEKISLKQSPLFRSLNANISRTAYDQNINEPIWNPLIKDFHMKIVWSF